MMSIFNWRISIITFIIWMYMIHRSEQQLRVRIYSNLAEITQLVTKLPLEFSIDNWSGIISESIILFGTNLTVTSQSITQKANSLNGTQVYVRSPISTTTTGTSLIRATIVKDDPISIKVKVENELIAGQTLYFTVSKNDIFYLTERTDPIVQVDFTHNRSGSRMYVNYLRRGLSWQAQYQLNIQSSRSDLITDQ